jgi:hypothetical protein
MNVVVEVLAILLMTELLEVSTGLAVLIWVTYVITKMISWAVTSIITALLKVLKEALKD